MRYFAPRFQIATLAGEQKKLLSKIGGISWGLPADRWPICRQCERQERLLAQLCHEPPMLDLGSPSAVLHLFQCMECGGIDYTCGNIEDCGRDTLVIDRSELGEGLSLIPGYDDLSDLGKELIGEFWITGWEEGDDGIPAMRLPEFFDERKLRKIHNEFPDIDWFDSQMRTRFGGTPRWSGNGPMSFPEPPFEFSFQLDNWLFLPGLPPKPNEAGCMVLELDDTAKWETARPTPDMTRMNAPWVIQHEGSDDHHYAEYTNFGSDGTAYVFVDRSRKPYTFKWFWNR